MHTLHSLRRFAAALLWAGMTLGAVSANANDMSAEDIAKRYGADPSRGMVTISPNGKAIALLSQSEDDKLVLVHSLTDNELITGANLSDINPNHLYFISDQHLIMVVSEEKRVWRSRFDMSTAYSLNLQTGDLKQLLTPGDVIWRAQSGLGRIVGMSEDRKTLYMPAFAARNSSGINPDLALLAVDIENPRRPTILTEGHPHTRDYFVDPQGKVIAEIRVDEDANREYVLVPDGDHHKTIYSDSKPEVVSHFLGTSPDRSDLILLRNNEQTGLGEYLRLSLDDGSLEPLRLGRDSVDAEQVLSRIDRTVYGVRFSGFHPRYHLFDSDASDRLSALQTKLSGHSVYLSSLSADNEDLVIRVEGSSTSGDYYLSSEGKPLRHLTSTRPVLPDGSVNPMVEIEYKARDGMTIPTLITLPRSKAEQPRNLPTVIYPHGGPHAYDRLQYEPFAQAMAAQGYAVIQPQFRGSTGFGIEHWQAGQGEWGRAMQDDLTDAVRYLVDAGLSDPDRVCIVGASYGGYAALAGAAFTPELYNCAVSINGVSDLTSMMEHDEDKFEDRDWVYEHLTRSIAKDFFTPERIAAYSPANFADGIKTPVMLIHGEDDKRVPIEQSELMHERLKQAGKPVELVRLKDSGHSRWEEDKRLKAMTRLLEFLDQHLAEES